MWPQGCPISIRVARRSCGLLSSQYRANRPHLGLGPETLFLSSGDRDLGLNSRFTRRVRPRLEWNKELHAFLELRGVISWSPLSGLKGVKPPVEF